MLDHHDNRQQQIQARIDLAPLSVWPLALRHEGVCNALDDARTPLLINPKGVHFARITASSIILMDEDGNTLEGTGRPPKTGTRSTPASTCATHRRGSCCISICPIPRPSPRSSMAVSKCAIRTRPLYGAIAYDDFSGIAVDVNEGDRMAEVMREKRILFLPIMEWSWWATPSPRPSTISIISSAPPRFRSSPCRPAAPSRSWP